MWAVKKSFHYSQINEIRQIDRGTVPRSIWSAYDFIVYSGCYGVDKGIKKRKD